VSTSAGRALEVAYRHHIDDTDAITDAPTIRLLRRTLTDYEPMLQWAEQAIAAYIDGASTSLVDSVAMASQQLLGHLGGLPALIPKTDVPSPLRSVAKPFQRGSVPCAMSVSRHSRTPATTTPPT